MTRTETHTVTTTRQAAVHWQFLWAMTQALENGERHFTDVVRPALEQRILLALRLFAYGTRPTPEAEIHLFADWTEHEERLNRTSEFVIPRGWTDEVSPQLRLGVKKFLAQVDEEELTVRGMLSLIPGRALRGVPPLRRGKLPRMAAGRIMCDEELRHLPEVRMFFAQAND